MEENDFIECMKTFAKSNFKPRQATNMFECDLTKFFKSRIDKNTLNLIREEFVSWLDVLVGTRREMLDLGISEGDIGIIKSHLELFKEKVTCLQTVQLATLEELCE